jgi:hypothetical protein
MEDLLAGRSEPAHEAAASTSKVAAPPRARRGRSAIVLAFVAGVIFATLIARLAFDRQDAEPPGGAAAPPAFSPPAADSRGSPPAATPSNVERAPQSSASVASRENSTADKELARPPDRASVPPAESLPAFINLPAGMRWARAVDGGVPNTLVAMSPDGRLVVYSARERDEVALWLRSLTFNMEWNLTGTDNGISPFWSPDSNSIGFFADRQLKRIDLNGLGTRSRDPRLPSVPVTLTEVRSQRGGTWGPDNTIVFAPFPGVLKRMSANGGVVSNLTQLDSGEPHHVRPQFFPGTRYLLYRVTSGNGRGNPFYVTSLDGHEKKLIGRFDSGNVIYAHGDLLFMQSNTLMAQAFDVKTLAVTGLPRPIAGGVLLSTGSPPVFGVFSASQTGRLVYLSQGGDFNDPMNLRSNWAESPPAR